ncbi:MAG: hypothetical protein ACP5VR_07620 [Acidimicrobiales bacterium]
MRRKSFDALMSAGGVLMTIVLIAAGALLFWGYSYASNTVTSQLAAQKITFPSKAAFEHPKAGTEITPSMIPSVSRYAGEQLTNGAQAEVFANDFIAVHLKEIGGGMTYSQLSSYERTLPPGSAAAKAVEAKVQTVFQGTTLRGMLLNAYGWWKMGQLAFLGSIVSWVLAGVMALLSVLGLLHFRRAPIDEEFPPLRELALATTSTNSGPHATTADGQLDQVARTASSTRA